jgi:TPR repeat protein
MSMSQVSGALKESLTSRFRGEIRSLICCVVASVPIVAFAQLNNPYDPANHARGKAAFDAKQYGEALSLMRPFASRGDPEAEFVVGNILAQGLGTPRDPPLGLHYLMNSAAGGYPRAQAAMGIRYVMGQGVPKDNCRALDMFRKAYAQDPKLVANEMGNMYKDGLCVQRDLRLAQLYYAGSPTPEAKINTGNLARESPPEIKAQIDRAVQLEAQGQFAQAINILEPLAQRDDMHAQEQLAYCYWVGDRAPNHYARAADYLRRASDHGSGFAKALLGNLYEMGEGVSKDENRAFALYQAAADKKDATGLFFLARANEFGIGTKKDRNQAIILYTQAGQQGNARGVQLAEFLKNPNNIDYRTEAEYQAARQRDAAQGRSDAKNVSCFHSINNPWAPHKCWDGNGKALTPNTINQPGYLGP